MKEEFLLKKTLVSALTTALVVGAASTTFAAANPFSDVPADHWAYDAVSQLAADGVIDGYGDSTFKGNRNITRYEMAQMVAKAMAKNTSGADKALVDKLAAEFAEELNNLGVRVSNLERNADMVKWNGKAEYTYTHYKGKVDALDYDHAEQDGNLLFRLEPTAEVNDHWHVKARLDAATKAGSDAGKDGSDRVKLERLWAQGDYGKFQVKLGKFASLNDDTFADTAFTGAEVSYGSKKLRGILGAGRLNTSKLVIAKANAAAGLLGVTEFTLQDAVTVVNAMGANVNDKTAGYQYLGVEGKVSKFDGGLYWHRVKTSNLKLISGVAGIGYADSVKDKANIIGVKAGYNFDGNVALKGFYNNNHDADRQKNAYSIEVDYKGAQQENKGTWGAWVAYRRLGAAAMVHSTYDVIETGFKGWEIGANYTPFKNIVATVRYGDERYIDYKDAKSKNFFGRVEFFF